MAATRSHRWLLVLLAAVGLLADQGTKYGMFRWLYNDRQPTSSGRLETWTAAKSWYPPDVEGDPQRFLAGGRYDVIPGWFGFIAEFNSKPDRQPWDNRASGLQTWSAPEMPHVNEGALFGMGGSTGMGNTIFAIISVLAAVGIIVWAALRGNRADRWMCAALGLILGGTVGNCYDRIVFDGVRDFLYFYKINWPVFNVADCCLVCGAIILLGHAFLVGSPKADPAPAPTTA
jgi:signal peptidase II